MRGGVSGGAMEHKGVKIDSDFVPYLDPTRKLD
jgi:hypothetical protein